MWNLTEMHKNNHDHRQDDDDKQKEDTEELDCDSINAGCANDADDMAAVAMGPKSDATKVDIAEQDPIAAMYETKQDR